MLNAIVLLLLHAVIPPKSDATFKILGFMFVDCIPFSYSSMNYEAISVELRPDVYSEG